MREAKINELVETEDHNDKEEYSNSEKDIEESETFEGDERKIINSQINNIHLLYKVLDVNSNSPQIGKSDTCVRNMQVAKFKRTKPEKGMGYTSGQSIISSFMFKSQEEGVNLDTVAYFTCVGINYLQTLVPDWKNQLIPIQGVKLDSES
ncbi:hypothetical protein O181_073842 [Austropuccinia psidii MF-1]|uniref:Uncharacterized protein n=1 Tax=Austropuccinia psidii MF-1 TaxID=1389203 RepID=A0A9Q3F9V7_9BASI|nr:hypothetical protein [Austropuccinia psidii MF-1]